MLASIIPDAETLLRLEPEELVGPLLGQFNGRGAHRESLNRHNLISRHRCEDYPLEYRDRVGQALMEAWMWLEREGLVAPKPRAPQGLVLHHAAWRAHLDFARCRVV